MDTRIKAVIPAAGLGTRFLPATKAMPKEMLPVVDKPAIQYVVEEAVAAGIDDVLVIIGRNKNALANHFDRVTELEHTLEQKGDDAKLARVVETSSLADIHFVRQGDPKGLGHAVLRARKHVGAETFAVMLGDDLIDARDPLLTRMIEVSQAKSATVVALMEVDPEQIHLYGCAAVEGTEDDDVVRVTGLVEKPSAAEAPSNLAIIGTPCRTGAGSWPCRAPCSTRTRLAGSTSCGSRSASASRCWTKRSTAWRGSADRIGVQHLGPDGHEPACRQHRSGGADVARRDLHEHRLAEGHQPERGPHEPAAQPTTRAPAARPRRPPPSGR